MNFSEIEADLKLGASFIQRYAPMAEKLGIPGLSTAATVSEWVADTTQAALTAVDEGRLVATTDDVATLEQMLVDAQAKRHELMTLIDES